MVSLRFFRDNPKHVAMRLRGWWFERGKLEEERRRMSSIAGEQSRVAESVDALDLDSYDPDDPDQEVKDTSVAYFDRRWITTPSLFRYLQRVDPDSLSRQWHWSPGLAQDIWHLVNVDLPVKQLLLLHFAIEVLLVFLAGCVLQIVCWLEATGGSRRGGGGASFTSHMLLSAHNIFPNPVSVEAMDGFDRDLGLQKLSLMEAAVLSLAAWVHWILLTVSAAVVTARAMRPQPQIIFAQDCVVDGDELVVRVKVIRASVKLVNVNISLCCLRYGRMFGLKITNPSYPAWASATPINIRHPIDDDSPFNPDKGDPMHVMSVMVGLSAQDAAGLPISGDAEYWNMQYLPPATQRIETTEKHFKFRFGKIRWDCKFRDCLELLADGTGESTDGVIVQVNMDNFSRAVESVNPVFLSKRAAGSKEADQDNDAQRSTTGEDIQVLDDSESCTAKEDNAISTTTPVGDAVVHTGDAEEDIASELAEPWAIRRQASGGANAVMRASSTGSVRSSSDLELKVRAIIHNSQPDVT